VLAGGGFLLLDPTGWLTRVVPALTRHGSAFLPPCHHPVAFTVPVQERVPGSGVGRVLVETPLHVTGSAPFPP